MSGVRNYFVPRGVSSRAPQTPHAGVVESAVRAARTGKVRGFHLPILAACGWTAGSEWASTVLAKEDASRARRAEALLASAGYDPSYTYHGVLDSSYSDHELIVSVARTTDADSPLERWDGMDWGVAEVSPDGLEYVVLDRDVLVDVLAALEDGSGGVMLRPFEPKAWVRDSQVLDYPILAAAGPPRHTGAMVALPIDGELGEVLSLEDEGGVPTSDLHVTLAYLGDTEETAIDYQAVQRATAKWVRRFGGALKGEVSGPAKFTAGEEPVAVALVDIPELPDARQLLVRLLEAEGVSVVKDHGYTPHVTLAYADLDVTVPNVPLEFDRVAVHYADDVQQYPLGQPVVAAGGAGPDLVYAIVDEFDTNAVLDILRVSPGPTAYRREGGKWVKDDALLQRIMGVDPPPVVTVRADQVADVIAQVDAYDQANPPAEAEDPVTAAAVWDEKKYKREGGKFAKKDGSASAAKPKATVSGPKRPPRGPQRPQAGSRPAGRPSASIKRSSPYNAGELIAQPQNLLTIGGDDNATTLDLGLGPEFWDRQPPGFREFARKFLNDLAEERDSGDKSERDKDAKKSDDGRNEKGERTGEAGDGKRDVAKGDQRSAAQEEAQAKAAAEGGKKQGGANLQAWMKKVPPKFRKAMAELVEAAAAKWGKDTSEDGSPQAQAEAETAERISRLDKADRDFETSFAKEGLGEARAREIFDRQIVGAADRLLRSGANAEAIERVMRRKVMEERRRRAEFDRQRKLKAEQERVRRITARNRESDVQATTAAGTNPPATTAMPGDLKGYWSRGKGAAKIRWGTSGDFDRCTRALAKYLKPGQVKGACANLHKLATGSWPGKGREH